VTLDPSSISELLAKNEQGLLSQQEFFKIFLISVQNSLTTNQRLSAVEKKLEEAESRLEKVEVVGDSVSVTATEPEKQVEEVAEAGTDATEESPVTEEASMEQDITSLVENAEKLQSRTSRKRAKASGAQSTARVKRTKV